MTIYHLLYDVLMPVRVDMRAERFSRESAAFPWTQQAKVMWKTLVAMPLGQQAASTSQGNGKTRCYLGLELDKNHRRT